MLEKGRNHLLALEPPFEPLGHVSNDEIKFVRRHFLGPDPFLEPRTYRRDRGRRRPPVRRARSTTCRRPSAAAASTPTASCPASARSTSSLRSALGPIDGADVVDWPVDYDETRAVLRRGRAARRRRRRRGRQPVRGVASRPVPDAARAPTCSARSSRPRPRRELGYHPYRAPTGVNSVPYDGRPACNNCGFCGVYGCPIEAKGDPVAPLRRALRTGRCEIRPESLRRASRCSTPSGRTRTRRALPRRRRQRARGAARARRARGRRVRDAAPAAALGDRATRRVSSAATSCTTSRRSCSARSRSALHGHRGRSVTAPARRPHDRRRRRSARPPRDARPALLPRRHRRARRRRPARSWRRCTTPPGVAHTREMLDSPMRDRLWAFTMQGEDLPQVTNRIDLDPTVARRVRLPGRAGHLRRAPPRARRVATTPRRSSRRVMREAGAESTFSATSPPQVRRRPAARSAIAPASAATSWARAAWATTRRRASSTLAALPRRREHGVHRLVGVPDLDRLRPDAHDRRPRLPRRATCSPTPPSRRPPPTNLKDGPASQGPGRSFKF